MNTSCLLGYETLTKQEVFFMTNMNFYGQALRRFECQALYKTARYAGGFGYDKAYLLLYCSMATARMSIARSRSWQLMV